MTLEEAKFKARGYWGENASADLRTGRKSHKYVVGSTTMPSRLGGYVSTIYGASWTSFEEAFTNAVLSGHLPGTDFGNDEAIEFEA